MKTKLISIIAIILVISTYTISTFATTQSDVDNLKSQKESLEKQTQNAKNQLNEIKEDKADATDELENVNKQISTLSSEISDLEGKLSDLNESISAKEDEITNKEKELKEKEELLKKRMVALYKGGGTSYLDVLLGSNNYLDMLSSYDVVSEIADADTKLMDQISEEKTSLENSKKELEEQKTPVQTTKDAKDSKNAELKVAQAEKQAKVSQLSDAEQKKQKEYDDFNQSVIDADAQIKDAIKNLSGPTKKNTNTGYTNNSNGTLGWPLDSQYAHYSYITSYFGQRKAPTAGASTNHGAIDIGVKYQPVYASEAGVVVFSGQQTTKTGQLTGYGNYIIIWHKDKGQLYTLYAHLSSKLADVNDYVSRGQQIAISGSTGTSTGPHLHFEVRSGGNSSYYRVDPLNYVIVN